MMVRVRRGFTLIELLVVIAIIAILAAIMFPAFVRIKENANRTRCVSNFKQVYTCIVMYCDDTHGYMPMYPNPRGPSNIGGGFTVQDQGFASLWPYAKNDAIFSCRNAKPWGQAGYDKSSFQFTLCYPSFTVPNHRTFPGSFHFWPHIYSDNPMTVGGRLDADLRNPRLHFYQVIPNSTKRQRFINMGGSLAYDALHYMDSKQNQKGIITINMKGSVRFLPASGYPLGDL